MAPELLFSGLYSVEKYWEAKGLSGFKVYKFALKRLPEQDPPPWTVAAHQRTSAEDVPSARTSIDASSPTALEISSKTDHNKTPNSSPQKEVKSKSSPLSPNTSALDKEYQLKPFELELHDLSSDAVKVSDISESEQNRAKIGQPQNNQNKDFTEHNVLQCSETGQNVSPYSCTVKNPNISMLNLCVEKSDHLLVANNISSKKNSAKLVDFANKTSFEVSNETPAISCSSSLIPYVFVAKEHKLESSSPSAKNTLSGLSAHSSILGKDLLFKSNNQLSPICKVHSPEKKVTFSPNIYFHDSDGNSSIELLNSNTNDKYKPFIGFDHSLGLFRGFDHSQSLFRGCDNSTGLFIGYENYRKLEQLERIINALKQELGVSTIRMSVEKQASVLEHFKTPSENKHPQELSCGKDCTRLLSCNPPLNDLPLSLNFESNVPEISLLKKKAVSSPEKKYVSIFPAINSEMTKSAYRKRKQCSPLYKGGFQNCRQKLIKPKLSLMENLVQQNKEKRRLYDKTVSMWPKSLFNCKVLLLRHEECFLGWDYDNKVNFPGFEEFFVDKTDKKAH